MSHWTVHANHRHATGGASLRRSRIAPTTVRSRCHYLARSHSLNKWSFPSHPHVPPLPSPPLPRGEGGQGGLQSTALRTRFPSIDSNARFSGGGVSVSTPHHHHHISLAPSVLWRGAPSPLRSSPLLPSSLARSLARCRVAVIEVANRVAAISPFH